MEDDVERRSRLVVLSYRIIGAMAPPPPGLSDKEVFLAIASEALKMASEDVGPPKLPRPDRKGLPDFIRYRNDQEPADKD